MEFSNQSKAAQDLRADWKLVSLRTGPGFLAGLDELDRLVHAGVTGLAANTLHRSPESSAAVLARGPVHVVLLSGALQAELHFCPLSVQGCDHTDPGSLARM